MSNVINFRAALSALQAYKDDKAQYAALQQFAARPALGDAGAGPQTVAASAVKLAQVAVRDVQTRLVALGFKVAVDGKDGPQTRRGITAFQNAVGLDPTGLVDATTWNWMNTVKPADVLEAGKKFTNIEYPPRTMGTAVVGVKAGATPPGLTPQVLAPVGAPFVDRAKLWLLRPGEALYKKPVFWIGIGTALLAAAMLRSVKSNPPPSKV